MSFKLLYLINVLFSITMYRSFDDLTKKYYIINALKSFVFLELKVIKTIGNQKKVFFQKKY